MQFNFLIYWLLIAVEYPNGSSTSPRTPPPRNENWLQIRGDKEKKKENDRILSWHKRAYKKRQLKIGTKTLHFRNFIHLPSLEVSPLKLQCFASLRPFGQNKGTDLPGPWLLFCHCDLWPKVPHPSKQILGTDWTIWLIDI